MMRKFAVAVLFLLAFFVRQAVAQNCVLSVTNMSFGTYTGAALDGTATGKTTCQTGWEIPLDAGKGVGATETIRKMTGPGGAELSYEVFQDAARTINWGNTLTTEPTGSGPATVTFYGLITAGQAVVPGTYTDTLSTATTTFTVSATIAKACSVSATNLAFGAYSGALVKSTSTVSVNCTNSTPYNVGLNAGQATGATVTNRSMTGPAKALLHYQLFSNSGYTTNWGNTVGTDTLAGSGNGAVQPLTVYGQIPAVQLAAPGSYTDTIIVSVTY
jgi:spore coat protein U-like protein